jgi:hypothetical protein
VRLRDIKRAIQSAYRETTINGEWHYLQVARRLAVQAPYSTGTVVYDHTGGSSERLITLTGGTFPSWAANGHIKIGNVLHAVDQYLTSTTLTLDSYLNPGADVSSSAFTLYNTVLTLAPDVLNVRAIYDETGNDLAQITANDWLEKVRCNPTSGKPQFFAITGSPDEVGAMSALLYPLPYAAVTLDFISQRYGRKLRLTGQEQSSYVGTVSGSLGGTTITGSGTAFAQVHVGSVIRFSGDTGVDPTSLEGENPYIEQAVVKAVASATSLTLDRPLQYAHAATKYKISDRVDLDPAIYELLYRMCELKLAEVRADDKKIGLLSGLVDKQSVLAREADARQLGPKVAEGPMRDSRIDRSVTTWRG